MEEKEWWYHQTYFTLNQWANVLALEMWQLFRLGTVNGLELIKRGKIKAHSNPLHPALTDANKIRRVEWILSLIQEDTIQRHPIYKAMYDFVPIDEKWFYLTKKTQRVYLAHKEKVCIGQRSHQNSYLRPCSKGR